MTDPVATSYRECAELLSAVRRIVGRWIDKAHGEGSFDRVCPADLAERLLGRRRAESKLSRTSAGAEELLGYTTFTDLSELLLDHLELLDRLVPRLAPSAEDLMRRLEEMEVIRLRLARAKPIAPAEVEAVREFHHSLLGALRGTARSAVNGGRRSQDAPEATPPAPEPEPENAAEQDSGAEPRSDDDVPAGASEPGEPDEASGTAAAEPPVDDELFGIDEALSAGDDPAVVGALYDEVMMLADESIAGGPRHRAAAWGAATDAGWVDANLEALGLEPVARFHDAVDQLRLHTGNGANGNELRRIREELRFTDLLLELREAFLKLR